MLRSQVTRFVGFAVDRADGRSATPSTGSISGRWRSRPGGSGRPDGSRLGLGLFCAFLAEPDGPDEKLRDVDDLEALLRLTGGLLRVDGVAQHDHAVRA